MKSRDELYQEAEEAIDNLKDNEDLSDDEYVEIGELLGQLHQMQEKYK